MGEAKNSKTVWKFEKMNENYFVKEVYYSEIEGGGQGESTNKMGQ